ncbi:MAG: hypothetical protein PHR82_06355 [Endomicrobiaceae bacterium]|nr:hypothetical protein [Endomicrobiaceae bacterium]
MNLIFKKILAVIIGICLSCVILETVLQTTGFTLTTIKKYQNKKLKDPNAITILCLGESTTDGQWPPVLQKILNEKSKYKKFKVIDEAKSGDNTFFILADVDSYLVKYKPDCVILMTGINDKGIGYIKYKFKSLNLLQLIYKHIKNKYFYNYSDESFFILQDLAMKHIKEKKINESEELLNFLMNKSDNYSENTAMLLMWLYLDEPTKYNLDKLKTLIDNYRGEITYRILHKLELFFLKQENSGEKFKNWLLKNKNRLIYDDIGTASILNKYDCSFLLKDMKKKRQYNDDILIKTKILNKEKILKNKKNNSIEILNKIYNFNGKTQVIAMQYPTLPVEILKKELIKSKYYDRLIFISNEENFTKALNIYKTEEIFSDMFGGSFGHCTNLGNTIIANDVADVILNLYDKEN